MDNKSLTIIILIIITGILSIISVVLSIFHGLKKHVIGLIFLTLIMSITTLIYMINVK